MTSCPASGPVRTTGQYRVCDLALYRPFYLFLLSAFPARRVSANLSVRFTLLVVRRSFANLRVDRITSLQYLDRYASSP